MQLSKIDSRWSAMGILCLGVLMIVLDGTIVNIALPSIRMSLAMNETSLVWVVNAYLLTFGGCLLLGGRLGDLYGGRRLFLAGIIVFTAASVACGFATSPMLLIIGRAVQGIGGAVVDAVALSIIMNLFTGEERAKAMGVYGFVCAGGGSVGVLLGGVLTATLGWHSVFLVNLPIGVAVYLLAQRLLPADPEPEPGQSLDVWGSVTITASLMLAVFAIVNGNQVGWLSLQTLAVFGVAACLFVAFLVVEQLVDAPLLPLSLFRSRNIRLANIIAVLWAAAMFAWFFISALYLQAVLFQNSMQVGLAFLPSNIVMAIFSIGLSAKLVTRFGIRPPLIVGLSLAALGLFLFSRAPVHGNVLVDVIPGMILLGIGAGVAFNPVLLAAMNDVDQSESGVVSGVVNTSFMMGGALGLAILASIAAARTLHLQGSGGGTLTALDGGYQAAFFAGAIFALLAAGLGFFLRSPNNASD